MTDYKSPRPEEIKKLSKINNRLATENFVQNLKSNGNLTEEEIKFLSASREKKSSLEIIDNILTTPLTLENYEEMFCLKNFVIEGGTVNPEQAVRNIRYKDNNGVIVAIVQIDTINKKIRLQNLGNILPKQECFTPAQVGTKLQNLAKYKKWSTEDGGVNQFNGNIEYRYKNEHGLVMAAIITKPNGIFDTIAEYEYVSGNRSKMLLTNHYGQSIVMYDKSIHVNQVTRMDIDTDGSIIEITKIFV